MITGGNKSNRIDRLLAGAKAGTAAAKAEAQRLNAEWRELPEEERELHRFRWRYPRPLDDLNFDRARYLEEYRMTEGEADAWENPIQSSAINRRY